jgi:hypothetical protein
MRSWDQTVWRTMERDRALVRVNTQTAKPLMVIPRTI